MKASKFSDAQKDTSARWTVKFAKATLKENWSSPTEVVIRYV